jgi:hypothetical protein
LKPLTFATKEISDECEKLPVPLIEARKSTKNWHPMRFRYITNCARIWLDLENIYRMQEPVRVDET